MEEYPQQIKFCYTAQDLHEEYGLSLEGKLSKDLTDEDLPPEQWLTVFKNKFQKNSKIYLNHLQPHLVEDCRILLEFFLERKLLREEKEAFFVEPKEGRAVHA